MGKNESILDLTEDEKLENQKRDARLALKKTVWSSWVKKNPLIFPELNSDKNKCHYHFITEFVQYWP